MHQADRSPDAIMAPIGFARGDSSRDRLRFLKFHLAPVLGSETIAVFNQGEYYFIATSPDQTLLFPADDARHPNSRYEWRDQPEGLKFGYRIEGA